jgi:hypothetical protein
VAVEAKNAIKTMVRNLNDEIIRDTSKYDIQALFNDLEKMLDKISDYSDSRRGKICESLELELYYRFMKTPYLEKRINGLTFIIEKISMAKEKDREE